MAHPCAPASTSEQHNQIYLVSLLCRKLPMLHAAYKSDDSIVIIFD